MRAGLWATFLVGTGIAALAGAAHHGLVVTPARHAVLWSVVLAGLSLAAALVPVAATLERRGPAGARAVLPWMIGAGSLCFAGSLWAGLPVLVVFGGICALYGLVAFAMLGPRRKGAGLVATALAASLVASAIQGRGRLVFQMVWRFDHNGACHLIQIGGLILMIAGIRHLDGAPAAASSRRVGP